MASSAITFILNLVKIWFKTWYGANAQREWI